MVFVFEYRWLSVGSDLKFDARRDLDDVGAMEVEGKYFISSLLCSTQVQRMLSFSE